MYGKIDVLNGFAAGVCFGIGAFLARLGFFDFAFFLFLLTIANFMSIAIKVKMSTPPNFIIIKEE